MVVKDGKECESKAEYAHRLVHSIYRKQDKWFAFTIIKMMLSSFSLNQPCSRSSSQDALSYYYTWSGGHDQSGTVMPGPATGLSLCLSIDNTSMSVYLGCDKHAGER